ncbi:MAG TPA: tetratricopeptide repeat protein, partial [Acidobacteriota bacterium]|nr:tetratricopeptide repeat protein [Acidobacteriota bacterium]
MTIRNLSRWGAALLAILFLAGPVLAQYREYYVLGKVVDPQKAPLEGVEITLRDTVSSRSFTMKTKKNGEYKFVGLPRGDYKVVFKKDGFAVKEDEWKLMTPQAKMEKVEIPPVVMATEELVKQVERLKEAEAGVKTGADKLRLGDYDGALAALKAVLDKNPDDANALYLSGMAYLRKTMIPEAEAAFLRVTELSPKFAAAHYQLGVCYERLKQPEKALEAYQKVIELEPSNADVLYNAGLTLFGLGRIDEALPRFEQALALRP